MRRAMSVSVVAAAMEVEVASWETVVTAAMVVVVVAEAMEMEVAVEAEMANGAAQ